MTASTYNTAAIFRAAHKEARISAGWDRSKGAYRFHLRRHLREQWRLAKRAEIAGRMMAEYAVARPSYVHPMSRGYYMSRPRYVSAIGW